MYKYLTNSNNATERRIVMKRLVVLVVCLLIFPIPAHAKKKAKEAKGSAETTSEALVETPKKIGDEWLNIEITEPEQEEINRYYQSVPQATPAGHKGKKPKSLPPGLRKKVARGGELPPGWQMKIVRGEVLSEDIYQQATPLPVELTRKLPPAQDGTVLVKVEGKVIRLYEATRTILDVFDIGK
jgi:hypothetical protein